MKLLLDMGLSPATAESLRRRGYDAVHLLDEGLHRLPDAEIFVKARDEQAVLLTHDLENVDRYLSLILERHAAALEEGAILSVHERRIRLRRLPLED